MLEASNAVLSQPRQTFFHTVQATSSCSSDPAPQPAETSIFNTGLENFVESLMRLAVSGAAPVETDIDDYGLIGCIGLQRPGNSNEMPISAPIAPLDINQKRNIPAARRWTIVHEPENPHADATFYGGKRLTEQDWDLGPFIWRCDLCQYQ